MGQVSHHYPHLILTSSSLASSYRRVSDLYGTGGTLFESNSIPEGLLDPDAPYFKVGFPLFFCDFQAKNAEIAPVFVQFDSEMKGKTDQWWDLFQYVALIYIVFLIPLRIGFARQCHKQC